MKKIAGILVLIILGSQLAAQNVSTFSKLYSVIPGMPCFAQRVTVQQNSYVLYGMINDSNGLSRISVTKIDTLGNLLRNKSYGRSGYDYCFGNLPGGADGVAIPWGGYIESGYVTNSADTWSKSTLYRFDGNGDTLWTKIYNDSTNELGITVKLTRGKKYIVGGMWELKDYRFFTTTLKKTDTLGNTIWQKTYQGAPSHSREGLSLDTCKDDGYIICTVDVDTNYACGYSIFIMKTDSAGNPQWTQSISDPICGVEPYYILSLHYGSYLVAAGYDDSLALNFGGDKYGKMYLAKISSTGTVIWAKQYGFGNWGSSGGISSLQELANGDIIACGTDSSSSGFTGPISCPYGCILKVDSNGNQKWLRYYAMQAPAEQDYLLDIQPTPDGGYVSAGLTYPGSGGVTENIWVVKTDSLGCDTVGCNFATGISEVKTMGEEVRVYPNPSKGQFNFDFNTRVNGAIEIYNITGQRIYQQTVQSERTQINLSNQPDGMYFYTIFEDNKVVQRNKLVIER